MATLQQYFDEAVRFDPLLNHLWQEHDRGLLSREEFYQQAILMLSAIKDGLTEDLVREIRRRPEPVVVDLVGALTNARLKKMVDAIRR